MSIRQLTELQLMPSSRSVESAGISLNSAGPLKNVVCYSKDNPVSMQFLPSPCDMDEVVPSFMKNHLHIRPTNMLFCGTLLNFYLDFLSLPSLDFTSHTILYAALLKDPEMTLFPINSKCWKLVFRVFPFMGMFD